MTSARFQALIERYASLRIAVLGDFCLDRYLEIDPGRQECSLETGLPVHNVVNVRAQPGGAGTILNNLVALGVGRIYPIGFAGRDGEGFELWTALERLPGVDMSSFVQTAQRRTFTYCKPLVVSSSAPPVELNRLDLKNWTPTPALIQGVIINRLNSAAEFADALIVLDQVDVPGTGVLTPKVLASVAKFEKARPEMVVLADSRRGLRGFPPAVFKMNAAELRAFAGVESAFELSEIREQALELAASNGRAVFVTLAEQGILGATPGGECEHLPALPIRGQIDVVGAGDAVTANLVAAMAAEASLQEALEVARAAASIVIHKLGTTGTASVCELAELLT